MALRDGVHAAGRLLTRVLLYRRWRHIWPMWWTYLQLYLLGKRLTEQRELSRLRSLIVPGMVIADIGANVGFYTLEMAACVGPQGRILAFEPDPFNFGLLERRARGAAAGNIEVFQAALGDETGRAVLYCSAYNRADNRLSASHLEPHVEARDVEVRRLDEFLSARGRTTIDALKIDVQGNEAHVLRGARQTLDAGVRWIWVEFSPDHLRGSGSDPARFLDDLAGLGMAVFEVGEQGELEPVTDTLAHTRKMGAGYGDLVLMSAETAAHTPGIKGRQ